MILYQGPNKKSYKNHPKSFHKPPHFTILSQTWFASFSTKTIKKPSDLRDFMFTTCSTLALYKHGHITYLKRYLPSTFKIHFIPHKSYKGTWPGPLSKLINQLLCFLKWTSLCYVIHNKSASFREERARIRNIPHYKCYYHVMIQTYCFKKDFRWKDKWTWLKT